MTKPMTAILHDAEQLPAVDKVELIERLLDGLDKPDVEIDTEWASEGERRLDVYLRGETTAKTADEVLAKHLKP